MNPTVSGRLSVEAKVDSPYSRHTKPTVVSATDGGSNVTRLNSP